MLFLKVSVKCFCSLSAIFLPLFIGEVTPYLGNWIDNCFPKKKGVKLGVADPRIGNALEETLGVKCQANELTRELLRGVRCHFVRYIKELKPQGEPCSFCCMNS